MTELMIPLLRDISQGFSKSLIPHWFLRFRPEIRKLSGDVDILVKNSDIKQATEVIKKNLKTRGYIVLRDLSCGGSRYFHCLIGKTILQIELQALIVEGEAVFFNADYFLEDTNAAAHFPLSPPEPIEAFLLLLRSICSYRNFYSHHWSFIRKVQSSSPAAFYSLLKTTFDEKLAAQLLLFLENNDSVSILTLRDRLMCEGMRFPSRRNRSWMRRGSFYICRSIASNYVRVSLAINWPKAQMSSLKREVDLLIRLNWELALRSGVTSMVVSHGRAVLVRLLKYLNAIVLDTRWGKNSWHPRVDVKCESTIALTVDMPSRLAQSLNMLAQSSQICGGQSAGTEPTLTGSTELRQEVFEILRRLFRFQFIRFKRRFDSHLPKNGKLNIALIGMDGSGKGTLGALLKNWLEDSGMQVDYCYFGFGHHEWRMTRKLVKWKKHTTSTLLRGLSNALYHLLLPVEFMIRRGAGECDILLMDRHPLFEPMYSRSLAPIQKLLEWNTPFPDVVIFFTGSSYILWNRKKESDFSDYDKRHLALLELINQWSKSHLVLRIMTDGGIDSSYESLIQQTSQCHLSYR